LVEVLLLENAVGEVAEYEHYGVVLIDEGGLVLVHLGDISRDASCHPDHVALGPVPPQVLGYVAGGVGVVMDGEGGGDDGDLRSCERCPFQLASKLLGQIFQDQHVLVRDEHQQDHLALGDVLLEDVPPQVLDQFRHQVVLVDAAGEHHGIKHLSCLPVSPSPRPPSRALSSPLRPKRRSSLCPSRSSGSGTPPELSGSGRPSGLF
jgi:hypothetical protein